MKTPTKLLVVTALLVMIAGTGVVYSAESKYDPNTGFVIAPGYEITTQHCIACHSAQIVIQQGQTRSGWAELIEWMQEEQGMWQVPQDQLETILNYLSTNYGEDRPHFKGG